LTILIQEGIIYNNYLKLKAMTERSNADYRFQRADDGEKAAE
jgi:uncharacterized protein (DUF983 family)